VNVFKLLMTIRVKYPKVRDPEVSKRLLQNSKSEIVNMIDELKSDRIINKVGGRFKLTALVQRRLGELLQGARPLIEDIEGKTMLEIVIQEILRDKIAVDDGLTTQDVEDREKG